MIDEIGEKLNDKKIVAICLINIVKAFVSVNHRLLFKTIIKIRNKRNSKEIDNAVHGKLTANNLKKRE